MNALNRRAKKVSACRDNRWECIGNQYMDRLAKVNVKLTTVNMLYMHTTSFAFIVAMHTTNERHVKKPTKKKIKEDNESDELPYDVARTNVGMNWMRAAAKMNINENQFHQFILWKPLQWISLTNFACFFCFFFRSRFTQVPKRSKQPPRPMYSKRNHVSRNHSVARIQK